jgi:hypothetical protein
MARGDAPAALDDHTAARVGLADAQAADRAHDRRHVADTAGPWNDEAARPDRRGDRTGGGRSVGVLALGAALSRLRLALGAALSHLRLALGAALAGLGLHLRTALAGVGCPSHRGQRVYRERPGHERAN